MHANLGDSDGVLLIVA